MKGKYLLDTNILIYSFDFTNATKQQKANQLIKMALVENKGCISSQVIQEFINVAKKKFVTPLTILDCRRYVDSTSSALSCIYQPRPPPSSVGSNAKVAIFFL